MQKRYIIAVTLAVLLSLSLAEGNRASKEPGNANAAGATSDSKITSKLKHSDATVKIFFYGLLAMCFDEQGNAEVGVLRNPDHEATMVIDKITPKGTTTSSYALKPGNDLWIGPESASRTGASIYQNEGIKFDRQADTGDPEDFRWVVDMEGKEFHDRMLSLAPNRKMLAPLLHISGGTSTPK